MKNHQCGDGDNYAIFSDKKLEAIEMKAYSVDNVEITSNIIDTQEGFN